MIPPSAVAGRGLSLATIENISHNKSITIENLQFVLHTFEAMYVENLRITTYLMFNHMF